LSGVSAPKKYRFLTVLKSDDFIGKRFRLENGKILKDSEATFRRGWADSVSASNADELATLLQNLQAGQNLCLGVIADGRARARVVTTRAFAKHGKGTKAISRTQNHLTHPEGAGWLLLDFDDRGMPDHVARRITELGGIESAYKHIAPELDDAEIVVKPSSSGGVFADGIAPSASNGLHTFVLISNPSDSPAILDALQRRAWAAGLGWIVPSASGAPLVRSIVDATVGTPERIVFCAPPELGEGVFRLRPQITVQRGRLIAFETTAPDVDGLIDAEKARMRTELSTIKKAWTKQRVKAVVKKRNLSHAKAKAVVMRMVEGGELTPDAMVWDHDGNEISAADLVKSATPGCKVALPDPIEGPSYGMNKATLIWGKKYNTPIIVSHAHGARAVFKLPLPPSKAVWGIAPAKLPNRKRATLIDTLGKLSGETEKVVPTVLAVAAALANKVPVEMRWAEVATFIDTHLPKGTIDDEWLDAILARVEKAVRRRHKQALAPSRFSKKVLAQDWVDHQIVSELRPLAEVDGVTVVRAPMASGKTQRVAAPWIEAARHTGDIWAIAHRVSLIAELANRLNLGHYQRDSVAECYAKGGAAVCLPSITKGKFDLDEPKYVFIDEIRQVLEFLGAKSYCRTRDGNARDVFDRLVDVIRNAKGVLVADAGCDDTVLQFLHMCRPDDRIRVVEMPDRPTGITANVLTGEHCADVALMRAATEMRNGGRVWCACEGAEKAQAVAQLLSKVGPTLLLTGDNKNDPDQAAFLNDPEGQSRRWAAVVASPVIGSGLSIEHKDKPHFTAGFGVFSGGAIRPADAAQMLRRVRYITDWTIALTSLNRFGGRRVEDILDGREAATRTEELFVARTAFDELVSGFEAEAYNARGDFGSGLVWLLGAAKWTIVREDGSSRQRVVSKQQKAVRAAHDYQLKRASGVLVRAAQRWGEARLVEHLTEARRNKPRRRTRLRLEAFDIMDVIGMRELTQPDLDWWHEGGMSASLAFEDLLYRDDLWQLDDMPEMGTTLAHRSLRMARRRHYAEMFNGWNPTADDAVLTQERADHAIDVVWPRRAEFAASGSVPPSWAETKIKPKNTRAAVRSILEMAGLWFERKQVRLSPLLDSESNGFAKSGDSNSDRVWRWQIAQPDLAQSRARLEEIETRRTHKHVDIRRRDDEFRRMIDGVGDAVNELLNRLEFIAKRVGHRPPVTVKTVESPVFVSGAFPSEGIASALEARGWPVALVPD
jgi:putative DNA primase/helicase